MNFDEMYAAVEDARRTIRLADSTIASVSAMVAGRLKTSRVPGSVLKQLKDELRGWNAHTQRWM